MSKTLIPNYNTISTILDRFVIERVKFNQFIQRQFNGEQNLAETINSQEKMCALLMIELQCALESIFVSGSYDTMQESRTFK